MRYKIKTLCLYLSVIFIILTQVITVQPSTINNLDDSIIKLAANNIINTVDDAPSKSILVVASKGKKDFAERIVEELEGREISHKLLVLGSKDKSSRADFQKTIKAAANKEGLIVLVEKQDASLVFETLGRPDLDSNAKPTEYLFCDWLMKTESVIRTYGIDMDELYAFREKLVNKVKNARRIRITSPRGTDITIKPRFWKETEGEICTAPVEHESNGAVFIDGCAYWGPPEKPFKLEIIGGRVVNISSLDKDDKQQGFVYKDLTRDLNANVLAEFGIGINPGAKRDEELMESEQARGTCHFGFGRNIQLEGGENNSSYHFDLVIQKPTIEVDEEQICIDGDYQF